jgi:arylsulfatase A-like enzyme
MTQPDILFVVMDDLGIVDVLPSLMPNMTEFAVNGGARTFTRTYSMPICSQSRACMLFGKYGRTLGIIEGMNPYNGPEPPEFANTVASLLKDDGYSTALVGKWHLGRDPLNPLNQYIGAPKARGFDRWIAGTPENLDDFFSWPRVDENGGSCLTTETEYATSAQLSAAQAWWEVTPGARFLEVCFSAPHGPYHFPPPEQLGGFESTSQSVLRQKYECEIRSVDWAFGNLLATVGQDTIVVVVGDNGTPGNVKAPGQNPNRLKSTCYEGGIRVPLAIRHPSYPAGSTDRLVHIVDIPATLLWAAGIPKPTDWDGISLSMAPRTTCLSEAELGDGGNHDHVRAAMTRTHKLLRTNEAPEELYDLIADPAELAPLNLNDPKNSAIIYELREVLYG